LPRLELLLDAGEHQGDLYDVWGQLRRALPVTALVTARFA
jgi:hypothetical protein